MRSSPVINVGKQKKNNTKKNYKAESPAKKEVFVPTFTIIVAVIIGLIGLMELFYYRTIKNNCSSVVTGIVDEEGTGGIRDKKDTAEGKYLSTGKSAKYWIKIVVKTDGVFTMKTLYAGKGYGNEGDELIIHYNPMDPEEYYIGDYIGDVQAVFIILFVISGIFVALSVFFAIFYNVKKDTVTKKNSKENTKNKAEKNTKNNSKKEAEQKALNRKKRFEQKTKKYTRDYTNERICNQIPENCTLFMAINVLLLIALVLIFLSFYKTFQDFYTEHQVPFNDYGMTLDDYTYSVVITEKPQKVCGQYYDLTVGNEHILVSNFDINRIKEMDGSFKLRGQIKRIRSSEEATREAVRKYYQEIGYYDSLKKDEYAFFYLDCSKRNLWNELRANHPVGLVFGITLLIVAGVGIHESGWVYMFKHLIPACSGRRYKAKEIDALANHPDTRWLNDISVFATPDALIGLNHGITVVEYGDIARIRIKVKHHSERERRGPRGRVGIFGALYHAATDKYKEWDTYLIMIETKKHRRMVLTETARKEGYKSLFPVFEEKTGFIEVIQP